ncbi:MAG: peptidylprolyl isomerase [Bacteroidetes bacterium GWF2_33_38]|nr:MAG: peptidylprolyl isomerase [Bacteroidetes bacterium GWF2_33_38]OFY73294.1 MAG: peptidylprolyl isomerase [Bacteroidetes bacterium RIFOXYA12_FULL_33_9]OFY89032.1 MAG: peptidylprolyl isomerase [Bacteroidetes bacterium RIFOXYA2_FULL_33_7]
MDSMSYYLGISIGNNLKAQGPDSININALVKGMQDVYSGAKDSAMAEANGYLETFFKKDQMKAHESKIAQEKTFFETNKSKAGIVTLPSGLQYEIIKEGTGATPIISDVVKCQYKGSLFDGTVFDSSYERPEPTTFPVNGVIPGWTEALQLMKVGSHWKLYIPYDLAYGERGAGPIEPYSSLIFEIELLEIVTDEAVKK